jgi:hypothetical protein
MPHGAPVETNGLKSWVIVVSGELSMTSVVAFDPEFDAFGVDEPDDEHAPSPAASRPAAVMAMSPLEPR